MTVPGPRRPGPEAGRWGSSHYLKAVPTHGPSPPGPGGSHLRPGDAWVITPESSLSPVLPGDQCPRVASMRSRHQATTAGVDA